MCGQAKILDLRKRDADFIERAPHEIVVEASDIVIGIVEMETPVPR